MPGDRKNWCFTYIGEDAEAERVRMVHCFDTVDLVICYWVMGLERAPTTGRLHIQGYVQFERPVYLTQLKRCFGDAYHWEPQRASVNSRAADYCKKDGDFLEGGTFTESGFESDFRDVALSFVSGEITLVEIARQYPSLYLQYGRRFRDMESLVRRLPVGNVYRESVGSTEFRSRIRNFEPELDFIYNRSWVGYHGQPNVYWLTYPGDIEDPDVCLANGIVHNGCDGIRFSPMRLIVVAMNCV